MRITQDLDLLAVGIAMISIGILGFFVFFNNKKSSTNRAFLLFSLITILWSIVNYLNYQIVSGTLILWLLRFVMFFAVWQAFSFFQLIYFFPRVNVELSRLYKYLLIPIVIGTSFLALTPLLFSGIAELAQAGEVSKVIIGPGIAVFGIVTISLMVGAVYLLIRKIIRATKLERIQFRYILIGTIITFSFIIVFNFILPVIFKNVRFVPMGPVFILPFVAFTTYAIVKHHLFNIRVIVTEVFTSVITLIFLANLLLSRTLGGFLLNLTLLLSAAIFGFFLIRGTLREIRELERLSRAKSEFVSIASHQLRTPLTAIKGFMSMIEEGSGTEADRKDWLKKIGISNERLVRLVDDLLNVSRIERGTLQYNFQESDFVQLIDDVIADFQFQAKAKNLLLVWEKPSKNIPQLRIDSDKIIQVITNLIDNALKYTQKGSVVVRLLYLPDLARIRLIVQDTGIGIPKEDIPKIFELFSRGEGAQKTSSEGVGIGLYVARKVVEAHQGKIWAESEGLHKGSRFYVELPIR